MCHSTVESFNLLNNNQAHQPDIFDGIIAHFDQKKTVQEVGLSTSLMSFLNRNAIEFIAVDVSFDGRYFNVPKKARIEQCLENIDSDAWYRECHQRISNNIKILSSNKLKKTVQQSLRRLNRRKINNKEKCGQALSLCQFSMAAICFENTVKRLKNFKPSNQSSLSQEVLKKTTALAVEIFKLADKRNLQEMSICAQFINYALYNHSDIDKTLFSSFNAMLISSKKKTAHRALLKKLNHYFSNCFDQPMVEHSEQVKNQASAVINAVHTSLNELLTVAPGVPNELSGFILKQRDDIDCLTKNITDNNVLLLSLLSYWQGLVDKLPESLYYLKVLQHHGVSLKHIPPLHFVGDLSALCTFLKELITIVLNKDDCFTEHELQQLIESNMMQREKILGKKSQQMVVEYVNLGIETAVAQTAFTAVMHIKLYQVLYMKLSFYNSSITKPEVKKTLTVCGEEKSAAKRNTQLINCYQRCLQIRQRQQMLSSNIKYVKAFCQKNETTIPSTVISFVEALLKQLTIADISISNLSEHIHYVNHIRLLLTEYPEPKPYTLRSCLNLLIAWQKQMKHRPLQQRMAQLIQAVKRETNCSTRVSLPENASLLTPLQAMLTGYHHQLPQTLTKFLNSIQQEIEQSSSMNAERISTYWLHISSYLPGISQCIIVLESHGFSLQGLPEITRIEDLSALYKLVKSLANKVEVNVFTAEKLQLLLEADKEGYESFLDKAVKSLMDDPLVFLKKEQDIAANKLMITFLQKKLNNMLEEKLRAVANNEKCTDNLTLSIKNALTLRQAESFFVTTSRKMVCYKCCEAHLAFLQACDELNTIKNSLAFNDMRKSIGIILFESTMIVEQQPQKTALMTKVVQQTKEMVHVMKTEEEVDSEQLSEYEKLINTVPGAASRGINIAANMLMVLGMAIASVSAISMFMAGPVSIFGFTLSVTMIAVGAAISGGTLCGIGMLTRYVNSKHRLSKSMSTIFDTNGQKNIEKMLGIKLGQGRELSQQKQRAYGPRPAMSSLTAAEPISLTPSPGLV